MKATGGHLLHYSREGPPSVAVELGDLVASSCPFIWGDLVSSALGRGCHCARGHRVQSDRAFGQRVAGPIVTVPCFHDRRAHCLEVCWRHGWSCTEVPAFEVILLSEYVGSEVLCRRTGWLDSLHSTHLPSPGLLNTQIQLCISSMYHSHSTSVTNGIRSNNQSRSPPNSTPVLQTPGRAADNFILKPTSQVSRSSDVVLPARQTHGLDASR